MKQVSKNSWGFIKQNWKYGKNIRNNLKIKKIKEMSIVDITDLQEFYTALNCSFMYSFSLCKLVFLYTYLKRMCDLQYLDLLYINLVRGNICRKDFLDFNERML